MFDSIVHNLFPLGNPLGANIILGIIYLWGLGIILNAIAYVISWIIDLFTLTRDERIEKNVTEWIEDNRW